MSITRTEILKIADLAKLHFSEEELDAFFPQFQSILDYIEQLKEVNIEDDRTDKPRIPDCGF